MRTRTIALLTVIALSIALLSVYAAETKEGTSIQTSGPITVQGVLVDTKCYGMMNANIGNDHQIPTGQMPNCAAVCAGSGLPVGIVKDGKAGNPVYVLIAPSPQLAMHMAKEARITGQLVYNGSLLPGKIEVRQDGRWTEVKIETMMKEG